MAEQHGGVRGWVLDRGRRPVVGVTVVAYDKGLPSKRPLDERRLGQARTAEDGAFAIEFGPAPLDGTGRDRVNLLTRVLLARRELPLLSVVADGQELEGTAVVFGAPPMTELRLTVGTEEEADVNAFDTVVAEVEPLLGGMAVQNLRPDDIDFLARTTGIEPQCIDLAGQAVGLAAASGVPPETFYGLGRLGHPLDLPRLAALGAATLRDGLRQAIEARSIPEGFAPRMDEAVRMLLRSGEETVRVTVRMRDFTTGQPLAHTLVRAADLDDPDAGDLGTVLTDDRGIARLRYSAPPGSPAHRIRLTLSPGPGGAQGRVPGSCQPHPAAVAVTATAEAGPTGGGDGDGDGRPLGRTLSRLRLEDPLAALFAAAPPVPASELSPPPAAPAGADGPYSGAPQDPQPSGTEGFPSVGEFTDQPAPPKPPDPDGSPCMHEVTVDIAPHPGEGVTTVTVGTTDDTVAASGVDVPHDLARYLNSSGLTTLTSVRHLKAGLHGQDDLPESVSRDAVRILEAHADLVLVIPDGPTRAALIDLGYESVAAVAATPRIEFVRRSGDRLGDFRASRLHHAAAAQIRFLNSVVAGELAARTAADGSPSTAVEAVAEEGADDGGAATHGEGAEEGARPAQARAVRASEVTLPVRCTCNECSSALGPLAYLVDLLRYATDHLYDGLGPVNAAALQSHYHQPFADLPVSCQAADQRVRTLRLIVESLRDRLRAVPPTPARQAELSEAEGRYRVAAYRALLAQLGTSYEELLLADRGEATPQEQSRARVALAERLGIILTMPTPPEGDEISRLCLDPAGTSGRTALTEQALEALFGLADTTRDRLSAGAKSNDPNGVICRWQFRNAAWGRATSPDGSVFVTLTATADRSQILAEVFRNRECTQRVASGWGPGPTASGLWWLPAPSRIILLPDKGSGLCGSVDVLHTVDTPPDSPVEIVLIPRFTAWRLARLRALWKTQDAEGRPYIGPVVEPDIVPLEYLVTPAAGVAASLRQQRADALETKAKHFRQIIDAAPAPRALAAFAALVQDAFGIADNAIRDLARHRKEGEDITKSLAELHLTKAGLELLARVHMLLEAGTPVDERDWMAVTDICVRAWKHAQFPTWRAQEAEREVTLSPDHFRRPETPVSLTSPGSRWRVEPTELAEWSDVLAGRVGDEAAAVTAVTESADAAERQTMPALRDALVLATRTDTDTATGDAVIADRAEALSQQLFVDVRTSDCAFTTRAAHAIEALQAMLLAARGDRFRATPKLTLQAPAFDSEWKWIGSYATWRAAMFVQLWPENLLLPALHTPQTPAFSALLTELNSRPATPDGAKAASARYARHLEDVCSLRLACSTAALTAMPGGGYVCLQFLLAKSAKSGAVYWSLANPDRPDWSQGYWRLLPTGEVPVVEVIGATPYQLATGERYVYVFLKQRPGGSAGQETLTFVRLDVETQLWDVPKQLELPDPSATGFDAVLVSRAEVIPRTIPRVWNWSSAPQLFIRTRDIFGNYGAGQQWQERQLSEAGDAWEADAFSNAYFPATAELLAVADQGNNALFTVGMLGGMDLQCAVLTATNWPPRIVSGGYRYTGSGGQIFPDEEFRGALTLPALYPGTGYATNELYILARKPDGQPAARIIRRRQDGWAETPLPQVGSTVPASVRILPNSGIQHGDKTGLQSWFGFTDDKQPDQPFYGRVNRSGPGAAIFLDTPVAARPVFTGPFDFPAPQQSPDLQARRQIMAAANQANTTVTNRGYIKEASYLVPLAIAQALARSGEHRAALDWFRLCYDYTAPEPDRKIAPLLREEDTLPVSTPWHADGWLADPLAPHRIAATRRNCYTRYTVTAIAQCLCDLADAEFTRDNAESLPRARVAYTDALEVLAAAGLGEEPDACGEVVAGLAVHEEAPAPVIRAVQLLQADAATIPDPAVVATVVEAARHALDGEAPWDERLTRARDIVAAAKARSTAAPQLSQVVSEERTAAAARRDAVLILPGVEATLARVARSAETAFDHALYEITRVPLKRLADPATRLPWLHGAAGDAVLNGASPAGSGLAGAGADRASSPVAGLNGANPGAACAAAPNARPAHPVLPLIAGEAPPPDRTALGSPASAGLAALSATNPALALDLLAPAEAAYVPEAPVAFCVPPNPALEALRVSARLGLHKLRSCQNIAGMQRPMEPYAAPTDAVSGMPVVAGGAVVVPALSSARQPTQYRYSALIRRAKELTAMAAQMEAGMLRAMESAEAEKFARFKAEQELAMAVANIRVHEARITEAGRDITLAELQQRRAQVQSSTYQQWLDAGPNQWEQATLSSYYAEASAQITATMMDAQVQALQAFTQASAASVPMYAAAFSLATVAALGMAGRAAANVAAIQARTSGQINSFLASIERRKDQWQLEKLVADQDIAIGEEQIRRAQDHLQVAVTEKSVAQNAAGQARDTLEFLKGEFLDAALYDWMSQQLESAYRFFLQQATATARMAQHQLAFERQEEPPVQLRDDYWSPIAEPQAGAPADRRGLTGAARLSEDIQRLDDHAFASDRRRLQVRKTLSLARLYPMEFQRFRETGVFLFATPMDLFDRDFPGHYMRLVRQVRTSVIALAPPTEGVRATLSSLGLSRVVVGPETGQSAVLQRAPESVALTSALESTGMIELEPEKSELLLPFEGVGVDTRWELRMPKPANPFNYDTITDVLFTIDYTALDSPDYRHQVLQSLPAVTWDRAFSLRDSDSWYDLHNPDQVPSEQRMIARLRTERGDFPPNLETLSIEQVVLYVVRAPSLTEEVPVKSLRLVSFDGQTAAGTAATTVDGVISTRRGTWPGFARHSPVGDWELALPDNQQIVRWFKAGLIQDILLVVTHSGREPDWPE
ncbi:neuraminidase-like domain-containing protein [Micromonospora chersina]|uniref:Tc toxin subunit A-related protein n=1 Tax=Micromonospora chersina TaxID=47854 RepID=UPI003453A219